MLGVALHPNFEQNGHIFLLYVVDHHHLKNFGTPRYDRNANEYFQATIGRLTRYTARAQDGFRSVDPGSRRVLVGESAGAGFPIMHQSHGTGTLLFGTDGTLLASAGDGASYSAVDTGGSVGGNYAAQALAEGIIRPKEDVGAYRAQLVDSLAGLRRADGARRLLPPQHFESRRAESALISMLTSMDNGFGMLCSITKKSQPAFGISWPGGGGIVAVATHPREGGLYYIAWGGQVRKIAYTAGRNQPPTAVAASDTTYGRAPLTVQFTGQNSTDPEQRPLQYRWDFGDGSPPSSTANPAHTFQAPSGVPARYTVRLTVTDHAGANSTATLIISVNHSPPMVKITSPVDGTKYPLSGDTVYQLSASVADAAHTDSQLSYRWQTILHHNSHQHTEAMDTKHATTTVISPVGCDGQNYYYRITLTVTNPGGLSTSDEVRLYPDCQGQTNRIETVWVEDALPIGAVPSVESGDAWNWIGQNPAPFSGARSHQSSLSAGLHSHSFDEASVTLVIGPGDRLFTYVYLDPIHPPSELMLMWRSSRSILLSANAPRGGW